jgi:hypothetical protein
MKKLISFALSLLIILNTFGFNLVVIFLLQHSRAENLEIIEEHPGSVVVDDIIPISLKYDRPDMINSHEIRYNNEMYDIVYKKQINGDIVFYCLNDEKDTRLHTAFRSLNGLNDNPGPVPDQLAVIILKNLLKNYLPHPENCVVENFNPFRFCSIDTMLIPSVIPERNYPPPRVQIT